MCPAQSDGALEAPPCQGLCPAAPAAAPGAQTAAVQPAQERLPFWALTITHTAASSFPKKAPWHPSLRQTFPFSLEAGSRLTGDQPFSVQTLRTVHSTGSHSSGLPLGHSDLNTNAASVAAARGGAAPHCLKDRKPRAGHTARECRQGWRPRLRSAALASQREAAARPGGGSSGR